MNALPENSILPPRTIAKPGAAARLLEECRGFGRRGLLVHGRSLAASGALKRIVEACPEGVDLMCRPLSGGEPTLDQVADLLDTARWEQVEWVAAAGGGSVLDAAKACAGLLQAPLGPEAYHNGAAIPPSTVPFVAVPTTAGTGSECTVVSVLTNAKTGEKKSIRHASFMARLVILDAELLGSCPPEVIAHSGMDAWVQAVESFVSRGATSFTDGLCEEALRRIDGALGAVYRGERGGKAEDLLAGSYLAGLALSNARLGLVHGLAHPLGTRYHAAHGLACAVCLGPVLEFNRPAIEEKWKRMADVLGRDPLERTLELVKETGIRSPFAGVAPADVDAIVKETLASGSTAANPRAANADDVRAVLEKVFNG